MRYSLLLLLSTAVEAGDWDLQAFLSTDKWAGFGVGTMIQVRVTTSMRATQRVEERRETLMAISDTHYTVKVETLEDGKWKGVEVREKREKSRRDKIDDAGEGKVTVAGKAYTCKKKKVSRFRDGQLDYVVTVYEHTKHGVLRLDMKEGQRTLVSEATSLEIRRKVGDRTLACRPFLLTGGPVRGESIMSLKVPDKTVYQSMRSMAGTRKTELIALVVK